MKDNQQNKQPTKRDTGTETIPKYIKRYYPDGNVPVTPGHDEHWHRY